MTAENFSFPEHEPLFFDDIVSEAPSEIITACGDDLQCVFDYSATGDEDIGLGTLVAYENNTRDQEQACKIVGIATQF